ncbi:MAG: 23S rRNA pseudouridine(1911/1915/1917) synthase RluD [Gammaproteobacteria bacterium]|nr:23S rRNA pseudouridine(1911/1915/1917) synthase RluD [Gammaproteobacteria bacterium]MCW9003628.1 23S rRNA pseudouridine(1911/1915/1917) synthase RluD [Gammaproteobacteria bacterium]MCW9056018.1 23S rRNA pseudouridine(1911/1915/1917) synthase RluD [Gammaproteobacteria bacterium]
MSDEILTARITEQYARQRLDAVLVDLFPDYSRNRLQQWIKSGKVLVNGKESKPKDKMLGDETIELHLDSEPLDTECKAQDIRLDIVYEDDDILVINKPVGLVVHPAAGHHDGTLQNALLHHDSTLAEVPRAGIVHRLDKDTSGLLVVARNLKSHKSLVDQLQARTVHREYQAIVLGVMTAGGTVDEPIGRNPRDRKRQAVREDGKEAITHYRVIQRYRGHTHIKVNLETGRTHQIRVHMAHIHYPLVGDSVYGGRLKFPRGASEALKAGLRDFQRQALHAGRLGLIHPATGKQVYWKVKLPEDMKNLLALMEEDLAEMESDDFD